mgnify:CR=1 FL=1
MKNKKKVYVPLAIDFLHDGHIKILKTAKKYGKVIVGLLTDEAISKYKTIPNLDYKSRENIVKNISYVSAIIPEKQIDYLNNLKSIKPDFLVHADDWLFDNRIEIRKKVLKNIKKTSTKLIEPKHYTNIKKNFQTSKLLNFSGRAFHRVSKLKRLMIAKPLVKILESHNSLTGLIIENLKIQKKNKFMEFDAMWSSSLTDSATKGKPDNQSVDYSSRISTLNDLLDVTNKPIVFDADNGGQFEHISFLTRSLERIGVSAMIIEDKVGLKKNSLFLDQTGAKQDTPNAFAKKIKKICSSRTSKDFLVFARIESFILGKSVEDAINRAEMYSKAGADGILIHSKEKTPNQIFSFARKFKKSKYFKPMIAVPSTYSKVSERDLIKNNFKIVIYANHMLRAAYPAMIGTAKMILKNSRSFETENKIISIKKIINLIPND